MTNEQLEAIRNRAAVATAGEWYVAPIKLQLTVDAFGVKRPDSKSVAYVEKQADADFIANSRQDIPALLAEVDRLKEENERLESDVYDLAMQYDYLLTEDD